MSLDERPIAQRIIEGVVEGGMKSAGLAGQVLDSLLWLQKNGPTVAAGVTIVLGAIAFESARNWINDHNPLKI